MINQLLFDYLTLTYRITRGGVSGAFFFMPIYIYFVKIITIFWFKKLEFYKHTTVKLHMIILPNYILSVCCSHTCIHSGKKKALANSATLTRGCISLQ